MISRREFGASLRAYVRHEADGGISDQRAKTLAALRRKNHMWGFLELYDFAALLTVVAYEDGDELRSITDDGEHFIRELRATDETHEREIAAVFRWARGNPELSRLLVPLPGKSAPAAQAENREMFDRPTFGDANAGNLFDRDERDDASVCDDEE